MSIDNNSIKNEISDIVGNINNVDKKTKEQLESVSLAYISLHNYMSTQNYIYTPYNNYFSIITKCSFVILDSVNSYRFIQKFSEKVASCPFYNSDKELKKLNTKLRNILKNYTYEKNNYLRG